MSMAGDSRNSTPTTTPPTTPVSLPTQTIDTSTNNHLISINAAAQTPIKLTPTNYQSLHTQWYSLLCGYKFLQFAETETTVDQSHNEYWFCQDQLLRSALIGSLSAELIPFVVDAKTSYDIWHTLADTYAKPSRNRIMSLRESLSSIKKGSMSVTEFLQKIKQTSGQLAAAGVHIFMDEIVLHVLHGLPSEYKEIAAAFRARDSSISFQELHEKLTYFESYVSRETANTSPIVANYAAKPSTSSRYCGQRSSHTFFISGKHQGPPYPSPRPSFSQWYQSNRPRVTCHICEKPGHVA
ncbi:PREDICTED: uncharacterized protein LOC105954481 [Erythranthe guttata]|uniref:uncharacterized protein LOC105954481 n=1 Tax=Erythranthe guttata TaxID=4155 RepID=UPI00064DE0A3|nr:PREDICTED: uncharacterized protein LOC105954481 [Erythranthe guttata]|eukprot:XP_012833605.1 PREDICTED: uncharacterized protein LOC105954481 [Erythranthe guttata]